MRTTETTTHKFYLDEEEKELVSNVYDLLASIDHTLPYFDNITKLIYDGGEEFGGCISDALDATMNFIEMLKNLDCISWTDGDDDDY